MALIDLFRTKHTKLKPDPRVRWFGKLPSYPDYYSSGTDEAWTVEFNEWVLKGFEIYHGRAVAAGKHSARLPVGACAVRLPVSQMTVFVSVLDYGGDQRGRPFPLCFYVAVPTALWPGPTSSRVVQASRVIRDLMGLRFEVARFLNSPGHFETIFGRREVDLTGLGSDSVDDDSWQAVGKRLPLTDWFHQARTNAAADIADWERSIDQWGANLARHGGPAFESTVFLPVVMGSFLDAQIAGWIHWLEHRFDLRRKLLSLIVQGDAEGTSGYLGIIARDLVVDDFLLLTTLGGTLPYVENLATLSPDSPDAPPVPPTRLDTDAEPSTWTDFACRPAT